MAYLSLSPGSVLADIDSVSFTCLDGGLAVLEGGGLVVLQVEGGLAVVLVLVLLSEVSVPLFSCSLKSLLRMSKPLLVRAPWRFSGSLRSLEPLRMSRLLLPRRRSLLLLLASSGSFATGRSIAAF
jgi:hypothetical protein